MLPKFMTTEEFAAWLEPHHEKAVLLATLATIEKFAPKMGIDLDRGYVEGGEERSVRPVIEALKNWVYENEDHLKSHDEEGGILNAKWAALSDLAYQWIPEVKEERILRAEYQSRVPATARASGSTHDWYSAGILEELVDSVCGFLSITPLPIHRHVAFFPQHFSSGVRFGECNQNLRNILALDVAGRLDVTPGIWGPWHPLKLGELSTPYAWVGDYLWDVEQQKFTVLRQLKGTAAVAMDKEMEHGKRFNMRKRAFLR